MLLFWFNLRVPEQNQSKSFKEPDGMPNDIPSKRNESFPFCWDHLSSNYREHCFFCGDDASTERVEDGADQTGEVDPPCIKIGYSSRLVSRAGKGHLGMY